MMDLSAYRDIFIEELNDQLERMDQSLLALELSPSVELVQTLFRAAHTIKGSASTMDFRELSDLTHEVEYALEWVRSKKPEITAQLVDTLFRSLDAMRVLRDQYVQGESFTDFRAVVKEIQDMIHQPALAQQTKSPVLQSVESNLFDEVLEPGQQIFSIRIVLSSDCLMKAARYHILCKRVEDVCGSVLATSIEKQGLDEELGEAHYNEFVIVIASSLDQAQIESALSGDSDIRSVDVGPYILATEEVAVTSELIETEMTVGKEKATRQCLFMKIR